MARRLARVYASSTTSPQLGNDFASFVVIDAIQTGYIRNMSHLWIDFLRVENGRWTDPRDKLKDTHKGRARALANLNIIEHNEETVPTIAHHQPRSNIILESLKLIQIPERERVIFTLHFEYDLGLREAGSLFGITESRAGQIVSEIISQLRDKLKGIKKDLHEEASSHLST